MPAEPSPNVIPDDKYSEPYYIAAEPGIHGPQSGMRRPMLPEKRDSIAVAIGPLSGGQANALLRQAIIDHLVSWSECDRTGAALKIETKTVSHLRPRLFDKLYHVIAGNRPSDPIPDDQASEADYAQTILKSVESGKTPGQQRDETDLGN